MALISSVSREVSGNKFDERKRNILQQLAVPPDQYSDASPKGSVDEGIKELVDLINSYPGLVTTSSCAGRISVFLEGRRNGELSISLSEDSGVKCRQEASSGGKGGGGRWLFVSHAPVPLPEPSGEHYSNHYTNLFGLKASRGHAFNRLVHFKFEPMILHILTKTLDHAQIVLTAALKSGFRESGVINVVASKTAATLPLVAVRSAGLALETIVGAAAEDDRDDVIAMVTEQYLLGMVCRANERFEINAERISRFQHLLSQHFSSRPTHMGRGDNWEESSARKERKRTEGLQRRDLLRRQEEDQARDSG